MTDASSPQSVVLRSLDRRGVATLTLNRPDKGNAYDQAMLDALAGEAARLAADPAVRIVVLRGSGRHFCVGAEIGAATPEGSRVTIPALCAALDALPKPTVALVHGACIGGGVALLSCCDVVLTARCESHLYGGTDIDDTIARLVAYRDAGADVVYAPWLTDLRQIAAVVEAVSVPVNVLAVPAGPSVAELESVGVRRVSIGSLLTGAAYGALVSGARELLERGTSRYAEGRVDRDLLGRAFG